MSGLSHSKAQKHVRTHETCLKGHRLQQWKDIFEFITVPLLFRNEQESKSTEVKTQ